MVKAHRQLRLRFDAVANYQANPAHGEIPHGNWVCVHSRNQISRGLQVIGIPLRLPPFRALGNGNARHSYFGPA